MYKFPPILTVVLLLWTLEANAEYFFTMPRSMEAGSNTQFCTTLKGFTWSEGDNIIIRSIAITDPETNNTVGEIGLASSKEDEAPNSSDWSKCNDFTAPDKEGTFRLTARVSVNDDDILEESTEVRIKKLQLITLVQTDKPIYKPGQTVKFRAMTMDYKLIAKTSGFPKISIFAPNGMKIREWTDVPAPKGLVSLEMELSTDPVLGEWKIKANDGFKEVEEPFKVDKYVLPKFEVTITPPKYLLPTTPTISGTVCAKYTYGKPVKGKLKMEICYKPNYRSSYYEERPCDQILEDINGCFDFYIKSDRIKLGHRGHTMWGSLRVNASVTEEATGIELHGGSVGPSLTEYPLQLTMEDDNGGYFKPGFPFRGRVLVKNPDGSPAPGEVISVSATNYNSRYDWKKNFTSDENGIVNYVLTEITPENGNLNIRSEAVVYQTDWRYSDDEIYFKTYQPSSYSFLTQWYSASGSYIYIKDIDGKVKCDEPLFLDVFYNAPPESTYTFFAIVKAGDRVVHTVQKTNRFDGTVADLELLSIDPSQILQKFRKNLQEDCVAGEYFDYRRSECLPCPMGQYQNQSKMSYCQSCAEGLTSTDDRLGCVPLPPFPTPPFFKEPPMIEEVVPFDVGTPVKRKRRDLEEQKLLTHFTLEIPVTQDMAPNAKVLVYYIRDDFEVVATSIKFDIESCFRNPVKMEFTPTTVRPGEEINLHLEATPESTCFVGMVDKSINLLGGSNQLTPAQVFESVQQVARPWSWVSYWREDREYCERKQPPSGPDGPPGQDYYYPFHSYSRPEGVDSIFAFRDVEMWVVTDATLETRPCKEYRPPVYFSPGASGPNGSLGSGMAQFADIDDEEIGPKMTSGTSVPEESQEPERIRSLFPETWLWDIIPIGLSDSSDSDQARPSKGYQLTLLTATTMASADDDAVPMAMVSEVGAETPQISVARGMRRKNGGVKVNSNSGEPEPPKIRSIFPETWLWDIVDIGFDGAIDISTHIPDTITNWVGNTLCTHPEAGVAVTEITEVTAFQPFFLSFTLPYSAVRGEIVPVLVTVFNYLSECIAMEVRLSEAEGFSLTGGASSRQFCLCGGLSESTKFHIVPAVVGEIDIEATAVSISNENICKDVILSQEFVGVTDGVQRQLRIEAEGVPQEVTESIYLCSADYKPNTKWSVDMTLPEDLVPESERAAVSVIGDIMGPTLSNLKNLLRMPYGCGEQNMASWSPNIYVLQYLTNTNQLTEKIEEDAKRYMRSGYQRQMKYRHNDYSYSAWGENSYGNATGSSWLTAFVVKSMAQSAPYITIDMGDVKKSVEFLIDTQREDGCFPKVGKVFSSYMKGGLADGDNIAGSTAFTLIALLEANVDHINKEHPAVRRGFQCLEIQSDVDTYTLTVMAYAFSLFDSKGSARQGIMRELQRRKIKSTGLVYWKREDSEYSNQGSVRYWYRAPSAEVEMTAYVLLALLAGEEGNVLSEAQPIVQWITAQRNSYGGFSSTQDTVVALQALAKYASLTYVGESSLQLEVKGPGIDHMFYVNQANRLLYQSMSARAGQGDIVFSLSGQGCAMLQVTMKYNIYKLEEEGPAFTVNVATFRSRTNRDRCDLRTIEVCASYLKSGGVSNMAIAEVKMPTGWAPVLDTLDQLVGADRIAKYESDDDFVELYFDGIGRQRECVEFDVIQEIRMNPKEARVTVYDYYETKYSVVTQYGIKTFCGTKQELPFPKPGESDPDPTDEDFMSQRRVDTSRIRSKRLSCPICPSEIPPKDDQTDLICDASAVFKTIVGRPKRFPFKVKSNLRSVKKQVIDAFVNYDMAEGCDCLVLNKREARTLIFTSSDNLETDSNLLTLDESTTILPASKKLEYNVRQLSKLPKRCEKLKRQRRSKERKENRRRSRNNRKRRF